jgi:pimeloyl-ACP methyl ester carboxylesterase
MKIVLTLLLFAHVSSWAQPKTKKVLLEGTGAPIVLLAGGTADMTALAYPSARLSHGYKVVRMEHFNVQYAAEGFVLPQNYSVRMESEAIKYTLDSLQIKEPVVLAGHSYGGLIALDFALHYPARVRSLILIEPPVFDLAIARRESPEGMKQMLELTKSLTPQTEITESQVARFRSALMNGDTLAIRQHPQWPTWVKQKNRMRGLSAVGNYAINLENLRQFQKPVLIITGSQTAPFHKRINQLLKEEFPAGREVSVPGGHAIPATAPGELVQAILEFIR